MRKALSGASSCVSPAERAAQLANETEAERARPEAISYPATCVPGSRNFPESVTNHIRWYDAGQAFAGTEDSTTSNGPTPIATRPAPAMLEDHGRAVSVRLRDSKGEWLSVKIGQ